MGKEFMKYFKPDCEISNYEITSNGLELYFTMDGFQKQSLAFIPLSQITMVGDIKLKCNWGDEVVYDGLLGATYIPKEENSKFYVLTLALTNDTDFTICFKNDKLVLRRSDFLNKPCSIFKKWKRKIHYKWFRFYEEEFEFLTDLSHYENEELKKYEIHLTTLKNDIINAIKRSK